MNELLNRTIKDAPANDAKLHGRAEPVPCAHCIHAIPRDTVEYDGACPRYTVWYGCRLIPEECQKLKAWREQNNG